MPVYTIASAAGFEGSVVVRKLLEHDNPDIGFDPVRGMLLEKRVCVRNFWVILSCWIKMLSTSFVSGEYVDAVECGLVDPLKLIKIILDDVTR